MNKETALEKQKRKQNRSPVTSHQLPAGSDSPMRDVQKSRDTRNIAINKVGVKDIS
jgi:hypothetical protein